MVAVVAVGVGLQSAVVLRMCFFELWQHGCNRCLVGPLLRLGSNNIRPETVFVYDVNVQMSRTIKVPNYKGFVKV